MGLEMASSRETGGASGGRSGSEVRSSQLVGVVMLQTRRSWLTFVVIVFTHLFVLVLVFSLFIIVLVLVIVLIAVLYRPYRLSAWEVNRVLTG
jgi:hypothetical protein